jgi:hypothetical protein
MKITQYDSSSVRMEIHAVVHGVSKDLLLPYKSGEPLHYTGLDGDAYQSTATWRGDKLTVASTELERGRVIKSEQTFSLTGDGKKLISQKQEDDKDGHSTCTSTFERSDPVKIFLEKDKIAVDIAGQPFTNLYMGEDARKPYLYPLRTASGKKVTRGYPVEPMPADPTDHPHQKGLWVGAEQMRDEASGRMDLWENDPSYDRPNLGRIVFKDVLSRQVTADSGSFSILADWVSLQGESVVTETRKMTFYAAPADCRMFDVDLRLKAKREVTFLDHHDAVIGIRLGPAFDEKNGGRPVNAQGLEGEAQVRGKRSEWVDWQSTLDGEQIGVTVMDHPSNFSAPTHWHIRSMGLLVASPFAQRDFLPDAPDGSKTLQPLEELHLRYRVLIHPRNTDVATIYREFANQ